MTSTTSRDNPSEIANYLVQHHGHSDALKMATVAASTAFAEREFYGLSIWREVKAILNEQQNQRVV